MAQPAPPPQSVVFKTPSPTPAQVSQQRAAKAAAVPNAWSAAADPIVAAGPAGTGLHMTRSGRYVNGAGMYQGGVTPQGQAATAQNRSGPTAVKTDTRGFVASPTGSLKTGSGATVTAKTKPTAKVILHPNGSVEIQHHAPAVVPAPATAGTAATPAPAPAKPGRAAAATTTVPRPASASAAAPAAPVQTVEQQAQALLDPVEKAATDAINQRIAAQQAAINSSAQTLAGLMGKYAPASAAGFGQAEQGQAAVDAATGATLAGQGQQGQDELAAKLQAIGADPGTTARLTGTAAANTAGAVGAQAGRGSASLSDLISRGASAANYGATLPGVAGMYGLQSTKAAQAQGTTDTANAIAQLEAKYPDLVQSIRQNRQQQSANETTRAIAATQALGKVPPWAAKILNVPPGTPSAAVVTANTRAKTAASAATAKAAAATTKATQAAGKVNLPLSKTYGILVNANAEPILKGGKVVPVPGAPPSQTQGLSAKDFQKFQSQALGAARNYHGTWSDAKGNQFPPLSWQQFLTHGESAGIPINILIAEGRKVYSQAEIKRGLLPSGK